MLQIMFRVLSSYYTSFVVLLILAVGAAVGTFVENDFGNEYAKSVIYTSWWYQILLLIASVNMLLVLFKKKKTISISGLIFHFAFVVILLGAGFTHYFGIDGTMHLREGETSNVISTYTSTETLSFEIKLNKFTLSRYPGSRSESGFVSNVTLIDAAQNVRIDTEIFTNNTLNYLGYRFFQSSYDDDEKGTILTVNKDPGMWLTYVGYGLLFLGLLLTLFDPKSRIRFLMNEIKKMPIASLLLLSSVGFSTNYCHAQNHEYSAYIEAYLDDYRKNSIELSEKFGSLIVQGPTGRMKPLDTQNREVLNKLTGKNSWNGLTANQVVLGMFIRPEIWSKVNLIRVKTPKLRELLGVPSNQKLVPFNLFFKPNGAFKFTEQTQLANKLVPSRRGTFERDLLQVDELLNIMLMSKRGMLLKVFPVPNDSNQLWVDFANLFLKTTQSDLKVETQRFLDHSFNRKYAEAIINLKKIDSFQKQNGALVIPSTKHIDVELLYNKSGVFVKLSLAYLLFGLLLLVLSLVTMFRNTQLNKKLLFGINSFVFGLFLIHTLALLTRWYIGGYAPISNTYETMTYIAYSSVIAGFFFLRRSIIGLSAALIMAGVFLFSAYLGEINPQITTIVPVLNSFWLSVHVSVITASYGFFGVSFLLGLVTLFVFVVRSENKPHLDTHIKNITYINEATLLFGIILLTIGNFLGAIWANQSWGRYWGWDPKETWTYVSIIIYAILLHLRLFKKWYSHYAFAIGSVISFFFILMTYYGVNYYLTGLHSYATGDPIPFPNWAKFSLAFITLIILFSYRNRTISKNKLP